MNGQNELIGRQSRSLDYTIATALGDARPIDFSAAAGAALAIASGGVTTLTYYGAAEAGDTFQPLYTADNTAVTQTVAQARIYDLPTACFGCRFLKIVGNAAGVAKLSLKG